ncbi:ParB N-terminal domain-containing protein [Frigidibacter sp. MR17.24]|uniref:ParB N-terminal domain-containing protein n=1 Tax=Frigidibacter sp. MR17.24 TaxID=3127345 RepID=UPI0030131BBD
MAKRRRLSPAQELYLSETPALETKSALPPSPASEVAPEPAPEAAPVGAGPARVRPSMSAGRVAPIAHVAADGAAQAALAELSAEMAAARAEGRLLLSLPLEAVAAAYLVRDRMETDEEELGHLVASIRTHGQRSPIEVAELAQPLGGARYGLISGWRRLAALRRLAEAGEGPGRVLAQLRRPAEASEAYVAMVEENEVRLGLSYYERARIAAKAVEEGVFETEKQALLQLFSAVSRAKRSKIRSFVAIYHALDGALRFPAAIPERLGLELARLVEADPGEARILAGTLAADPAATPEEELARLGAAVRAWGAPDLETPDPETPDPVGSGSKSAGSEPVAPPAPRPSPAVEEIMPGLLLETGGGWLKPVLTLSGDKVDQAFRDRLIAFLRGQV